MLKNFNIIGDDRGSLISIESKIDIPFEIKRVYYIFGNKNNVRRGFHAHKNLQQVLIAVSGSCKILLDNGQNREEILLDSPQKGLLIKNFMWREMFDFSANCVLLVLASEHYDEKDYIRDYNQFLNTV
jgi:dTDP-4-dehydrorhamnose 3,5-epimerase-like enzyme